MFAPPRLAEVMSIAASLGINLDEDEAQRYRALLAEQLSMLDSFLQSRLPEDRPPLVFGQRGPGCRPSPEEDPYNAWLWRCEIAGSATGLLAGKRVSFKDHVSIAGHPITYGSYALDGLIADVDATVVTRSLTAGATVTGKNTHHGFAGLRSLGGGIGDYWDAINPAAPDRQAGGSSSGCAAAVRAGEVDIAFGGDQGGSIRLPASYCGVVGHKATYGLVSNMGVAYGGEPTIDHVGPLARTVADAASALQAVAGHDPYDGRQPRDVPESIDVLTTLDRGVDGIRIGVLDEGFLDPMDQGVRDGVHAAMDVLADAGARISRVSIPEHESILVPAGALQLQGLGATRATGLFGTGFEGHYPRGLIAAVDRAWRFQADQMATYMKAAWILAELSRRNFHGAVYAKAQNVRGGFRRAYDRALTELDVLALPTCPSVAPRVTDSADLEDPWEREVDVLREVLPAFRNVQPFSYTGHPALSVPCDGADGPPFAVQLVGRHFDDAQVLRVGHAYQQLARH